MSADNKSLGRFMLDGIPPAPRGTPQVEVTFDIDANGILNVTAKDKTTGKANSIRIEAKGSLSKEEVEKMKKDAETHDADDKKKKEEVEVKNTAEQLIYTSEKALKDNKDKVPADVAKTIEEKIASLKTAREGSDMAIIKSASEALSTELSKIGEIMAKAASASAGSSGETKQAGEPNPDKNQNGQGDGPVRDAEFKEGDKK